MKKQPYHDPTGDQMEHAYFCYLADKFEADPNLLGIALETIRRWITQGHWAESKLNEWGKIIRLAQTSKQGLDQLNEFLRRDDEEAREMRGYDPFPSILNDEEKKQFLWMSRH